MTALFIEIYNIEQEEENLLVRGQSEHHLP